MTSIRVRHMLRVLCCLFVLAAHPLGAAGQGVKYVQDLAKNGKFQQAFAQCRAVLAATPSADDLSRLRTLFAKYPGVQESGVAAISSSIDAARNEQDLLRAQSEVLFFARCVKSSLCDPSVLAALQSRFVAAASRLVVEAGIPVTFESNLVVDWAASTGSNLDKALERRIYQNTLANLAARDPRDRPSVLMTDRLFRYLLREPEAREEALRTIEKVEWRWSDLDGPLREVYPGLAEERKAKGGHAEATMQIDEKGVEFRPWTRGFANRLSNSWTGHSLAGSLKGHVVVSFNVHKNGTITDIVVAVPCAVDVLNKASFNAVASSNPAPPLPPAYPDEKAVITITFYFNETPPQK